MSLKKKNRRVFLILSSFVFGMVVLAFASVPLYKLFCQVTGYGGTTQEASVIPSESYDRSITIRFHANISPSLPWIFQPLQREVSVKVGEKGLAFYKAANKSNQNYTGTAIFNVTPHKVGKYFNKVDCFCFEEQTIASFEEVEMPVSFFIDPEIMTDPNLQDVKTITLSYTFLPVKKEAKISNKER